MAVTICGTLTWIPHCFERAKLENESQAELSMFVSHWRSGVHGARTVDKWAFSHGFVINAEFGAEDIKDDVFGSYPKMTK